METVKALTDLTVPDLWKEVKSEEDLSSIESARRSEAFWGMGYEVEESV